jgi:hypothetical protein
MKDKDKDNDEHENGRIEEGRGSTKKEHKLGGLKALYHKLTSRFKKSKSENKIDTGEAEEERKEALSNYDEHQMNIEAIAKRYHESNINVDEPNASEGLDSSVAESKLVQDGKVCVRLLFHTLSFYFVLQHFISTEHSHTTQ